MTESSQDLSNKKYDNSADTDEVLDTQNNTSPGRILRAAREELNYTIGQVAQELHLRPSVVLAMEEEKYDDFSSDVFLKGYFRSYCRLVNLHEQRMVELLESQLHGLQKGIDDALNLIKKGQKTKKQKKIMIWLLIIALIAGISGFVISLFYSGVDAPVQSSKALDSMSKSKELLVNSSSEKVVSEVVVIEKSSAKALPVSIGQNEATMNVESEETTEVEVTAADVKAETTTEVDTTTEIEIRDEDAVNQVDAQQEKLVNTNDKPKVLVETVLESDLISTEQDEETINEGVVVNYSKFDAIFSGDCWFTLVDGNKKTVFADLKRDGDRVSYSGVAPFKVVLGDASKVVLSFDGDKINLKSHTANNGRAQLTLTKS
jgi:cytoskeletal protein RodZ